MAIRYDSSRFTKDADFSTRECHAKGNEEALVAELDAQLDLMNDQLGYDTMCRRQSTKLEPSRANPTFPTLAISIGYAPRTKPAQLSKLLSRQSPTVVQIDYSYNEAVYDVEILSLRNGVELQAYSLINLIAEKYRSLLQQPVRNRNRRQDVYDLHLLLATCQRLSPSEQHSVLTHLINSCRERGIDALRESMREPLAPSVDRCLADPVPFGNIDYRIPIRLAQYPDNLFFAVPALLHANSSSEEPLSPDQLGPKIPGQVRETKN